MKIPYYSFLKSVLSITLLTSIILSGCKKKNDDSDDDVTPAPTDTCGSSLMSFHKSGHYLWYEWNDYIFPVYVKRTLSTHVNGDLLWANTMGATPVDTFYTKECGEWLYISYDYPILNYKKFRKSVTSINESWTTFGPSFEEQSTVIDKNVSITVPAGTFTCDKIIRSFPGSGISTDTLYFNNSFGDIKLIGPNYYVQLISKNF